MIVAVLALVAALTGTAIAQPDATTSAINKKKVKKIARKQINKLAPGLSVANAVNAQNAASADNAASLGGAPAGSYATRLFARVDYDDSTPSVPSQSGGIAGAGENPAGPVGFPQLTFPRNMTNCAVIATPVAPGGNFVIRVSENLSSGNRVVFVINDFTGPLARRDFNVVGVC